MANTERISMTYQEDRFKRLLRAYNAAIRWELWNSARLFENKLTLIGAVRNEYGWWELPEPPAAGSSQPY